MIRPRKDSGFTLLEMIIVLAISGVVLTFYAVYARKEADRTARENVSSALVQEMKGIVAFTLDADATDDGNPLYLSDSKDYDAYHRRIENKANDKDTGSSSNYYLWGDGNDPVNQQRFNFISKSCKSVLKSNYEFGKGYLPCQLSDVAKNNNAKINRVGFYAPDDSSTSGGSSSTTDKFAVNRLDIIVEFKSDTKKEKLAFAEYYPQLSRALANARLAISSAVVVHRASSSANWQVVMHKNDANSPVEFADVANNIGTLNNYASDQFGVRFSFNMSDNDPNGSGGSGGGANLCWNANESKVTMCLEGEEGAGSHGEDKVVALNMVDKDDPASQRLGTMASNVVMENTAHRVYIFKRRDGSLYPSVDSPEFITYEDPNDGSLTYHGELTITDKNMSEPSDTSREQRSNDYLWTTWDAFELVTPPIIDYVSAQAGQEIGNDHGYTPKYDDGNGQYDNSNEPNSIRFPVQTCPMVKQSIVLRDANGNPITGSDGTVKKIDVERYLFPRFSAAITSVSAYRTNVATSLNEISKNRANMNSYAEVGQLGGVTIQVNFAEQNLDHPTDYDPGASRNEASHLRYQNVKYLWILSAVMGMYAPDSGEGVNTINPSSIAYTVTRWCSSIPQEGTPADLLDSYVYQ